jgi:hypothetical protein
MKHTEGIVYLDIDETYVMMAVDFKQAVIADCEKSKIIPREEQIANAKRIHVLWNAADGMSNEEAVKALENYEEMKEILQDIRDDGDSSLYHSLIVGELLAKLEDK